jgi:DNA-directed RNA polymerase specialized sigma24 family protein
VIVEQDETILKMLCSFEERERDKGAKAFIKKFEARVKNWVKKQSIKVDPNDVWGEATTLMIHAIQSEKYKKHDSAELYTYFHLIVKSTWIKMAKNENNTVSLSEEYDLNDQPHEDFRPDIYTELNQHRSFVRDCLEKFDPKTQNLLIEIIVEDARLIDIFEILGLKNYNNAKQKYHKSKNALINCLKKHIGYGK